MAYDTPEEEAAGVVRLAARLPGETATLARTNNYLAGFEAECLKAEVKFYSLGDSGFWKQPEVKAGLNAVAALYPEPSIQTACDELMSLLWRYKEEDAVADNDPAANLKRLHAIAGKFETTPEFLSYAQRATHAPRKRKGKGAIAIGTVHAAKGLEWSNVILTGAHKGMMPISQSNNHEEEARIFFVAVSRAADQLIISRAGPPSEFLSCTLECEQSEPEQFDESMTINLLKSGNYDTDIYPLTHGEGHSWRLFYQDGFYWLSVAYAIGRSHFGLSTDLAEVAA